MGFTQSLLNYVPVENIAVISASSMGIFNGYALSTGKLDELEGLYRSLDIEKKGTLFYEVFFKDIVGKSLNRFLSVKDELRIPVYFTVSQIPPFSVRYFRIHGNFVPYWRKYVLAGMNFPFLKIFPTVVNRRFVIDGGAIDNIPLFPLAANGVKNSFAEGEQELDLIIVLHLDAQYNFYKEFLPTVPVLDLDVSIDNGFSKEHYNFSSKYVGEMLASGREYGERICETLFSGELTKENIQRNVNSIFVSEYAKRQRARSMDTFLSLLNRAGKVLRNERTCIKRLDI